MNLFENQKDHSNRVGTNDVDQDELTAAMRLAAMRNGKSWKDSYRRSDEIFKS